MPAAALSAESSKQQLSKTVSHAGTTNGIQTSHLQRKRDYADSDGDVDDNVDDGVSVEKPLMKHAPAFSAGSSKD